MDTEWLVGALAQFQWGQVYIASAAGGATWIGEISAIQRNGVFVEIHFSWRAEEAQGSGLIMSPLGTIPYGFDPTLYHLVPDTLGRLIIESELGEDRLIFYPKDNPCIDPSTIRPSLPEAENTSPEG